MFARLWYQSFGMGQKALGCLCLILICHVPAAWSDTKCMGICVSPAGSTADLADCAERIIDNDDGFYNTGLSIGDSSNVCNAEYEFISSRNTIDSTVRWSSPSSIHCVQNSFPFTFLCSAAVRLEGPVDCGPDHEYVGNFCIPKPQVEDETGKPPPGQCRAKPASGAPIYFGSGNKYLEIVDYRGTGPMPLEWVRYYNSNDKTGNGWSTSYSQHMVVTGHHGARTVVRPDGRRIDFYSDGTTWEPLSGETIQLERDDVNIQWVVTLPNGTVERFAGPNLVSITNRNGQTISLTHNANGYVVTHFSGRTLEVTLGHVAGPTLVEDPAGNEYRYEYERPTLSIVDDKFWRLEKAIYPDDTTDPNDNPTIEYAYQTLFSDPADDPNGLIIPLHRLLTSVTDENDVVVSTYTYDGYRAKTSEMAGGVEKTTVVKGTNDIAVTNPLGKEALYSFDEGNVTSVAGQATALCDPTTRSVAYDANGFIDTTTDENGVVTDYTYNSRGLIEAKTQASGTSEAVTTNTEWHSTHRVPTRITRTGQEVEMTYDSDGRVLTRTVRQ